MTIPGEPVGTPEELRVMAEELFRGAERCNDPEHRARLRRRAQELRDRSRESARAPGTSANDRPGRGPKGAGDRRPDRKRGA
ncbi:DUF6381 family protein [Streptomyces sp. NPDC057445]|uniref:DUF6381 family protein n=1 Tax=Streptomyces sp. NPDC057445 TaxID=3346136 RepID=UPI00368523FF